MKKGGRAVWPVRLVKNITSLRFGQGAAVGGRGKALRKRITAWECAQLHRMDAECVWRQPYFGLMAGATRETKVWQEAIGLAGDVIRVVRRATRRETKAFTDALMLSATAVASAVAEAPTRANPSDERECYVRARRSLVMVETQLAIARVSGIIPSSVHAQLAARVASLSQRVTNQMNHVDRQVDASPTASPAASLPLLADVT